MTDEPVLVRNPVWVEMTTAELPVTWMLPGLLPESSFLVLGGIAGAGKSLTTYALALGLATGMPVLGFTPPRPFKVVYFDQENNPPDRKQYLRWVGWGMGLTAKHADLIEANFVSYSDHLGHDEWVAIVEKAIKEHQPDVLIFDTANSCFAVEDENDNAEAGKIINELKRLQRQAGPRCSIILLKHAKTQAPHGKELAHTLRGGKAWEGSVDAIVYQKRMQGRGFKDPVLNKTLYNTRLIPGKVRAYGLSEELLIRPKGVRTPYGDGLVLRCASTASQEGE